MIVILPDRSMHVFEEKQCTVDGILARFGINPLEVIVAVNGRVVPEDTAVYADDEVRIIRIAHGG